jgi:hypothetical protein
VIARRSSTLITAASLVAGIALIACLSCSSGFAASLSVTPRNLTTLRTCTVTATPSTTTVVTDTHVRQATSTTNYGTQTTMDVASASSANRRAYLRFDLGGCSPVIPSSATIRLATLRLYVSTLPAVCRTMDIFRVTASWTESGITWSNQPFGTTINNPPTASRVDSFNVGTPTGCENRVAGYVTGAVVTTDVAAFVSGAATNFGWMIRDDAENSATARTATFSAKNLGTLAQAPQLVISYVTVP